MKSHEYERIRAVHQPRLVLLGSQAPYVTSQGDGRFPRGRLYISKEVNRKEHTAVDATPGSCHGVTFANFNYLAFF